MGALIRMGALIGIGALINKNTFEGGAYSEGRAYWKEGAKSNHYGILRVSIYWFWEKEWKHYITLSHSIQKL